MNEGGTNDQLGHRDSRRAAYRALRADRHGGVQRLLAFLAVGGAVGWAWAALTGSFPPDQRAVLVLFLLASGLWVTEAVPAFAVGLLILGYLVFAFGTPLAGGEMGDVSAYLDTWSSPVIWLILAGFFMAAGLARTGLDRQLFALAMRPAGRRPDHVLLAVMLTSAIASMFISNTSTTALLIGAVTPFARAVGPGEPFARTLLVAIPLAASIGGMGTIIGSPPNAIAAGAAAEAGRGIDFLRWMAIGVPLALGLIVVAWRFLLWRCPATTDVIEARLDQGGTAPLQAPWARWTVAGLCLVTVALWMTTPLHGIHVSLISLVPIVGLTMSQVLGAEQVRGLPWDTLMLVSGGLALGTAVVDTGLAARIAADFEALTGRQSDLVIFAGLALLTVGLSNFMSNTATVSLILPVAIAMVPGSELEMCLILGLSASCALLLPVSTPPNAVAFGTGLIRAADLRPTGLLIGLLGPACVIAWVLALSRLTPLLR